MYHLGATAEETGKRQPWREGEDTEVKVSQRFEKPRHGKQGLSCPGRAQGGKKEARNLEA